MPPKNERSVLPTTVAAYVLFSADRTCCICRVPGQPIQIHHIDGNPHHHAVSNLAVLCLNCHHETQLMGGFTRHLRPALVQLYRDDWLTIVTQERNSHKGMRSPRKKRWRDDKYVAAVTGIPTSESGAHLHRIPAGWKALLPIRLVIRSPGRAAQWACRCGDGD